MVTLRDIAAHVGVSVSTVSLVLNDRDAGRVNSDTAERIRRVADELGYLPNLSARGLRTRQTHTIGLLSHRVATIPFASQMLAGAQRAAWELGYVLLLVDTTGDRDLEAAAVKSLLQRSVEGLILAMDFHREVELPLVPDTLPVVILDGRPADPAARSDWVVPDEAGGARTATRHLVAAGHRRVGLCVLDDPALVAMTQRRAGYEDALSEAGIAVDPSLVVAAPEPTTAAGRAAAEVLLHRPDPPTAVFCVSDRLAFGVYQQAQRLGLRIPTDLSVCGFDNQQFVADSVDPGLTTVQLPHREMGEWAARQAIDRIRGEDGAGVRHRLMPCPLVERDSVAAPPTDRRRGTP